MTAIILLLKYKNKQYSIKIHSDSRKLMKIFQDKNNKKFNFRKYTSIFCKTYINNLEILQEFFRKYTICIFLNLKNLRTKRKKKKRSKLT